MNFKEAKEKFDAEIEQQDGHKVMLKATEIVNDIGANFLTMDGGALSEAQSKLAGYKFYLADFIGDLNVQWESLRLSIRDIRSQKWDTVTEEIKARDGKVKNKEQIENELTKYTIDSRTQQMLYETLYYKYKLKLSSIDSILTSVAQRIKELQKQWEQQ